MSNSLGGLVNIVLVVVFLVFVLGYMAFNVNYMRSFRMKDKIIETYEDYKGNCNAACEAEIADFATKIGYEGDSTLSCGGTNLPSSTKPYYCIKGQEVDTEQDNANTGYDHPNTSKFRCTYTIVTKVNVNIPIVNNIMNFKVFQIVGTTKVLEQDTACSYVS